MDWTIEELAQQFVDMGRSINYAPFPYELAELIDGCTYRDGWELVLEYLDRGQECYGLTLCIYVAGFDSNNKDRPIRVVHYMPVPAAAYNRRSWQRWLFEQLLLVERHEAAEFFKIDGERPYAPLHGQGNDPYLIAELTTEEERDKTFRD